MVEPSRRRHDEGVHGREGVGPERRSYVGSGGSGHTVGDAGIREFAGAADTADTARPRLLLVGCGASKRTEPTLAWDLYTGPLFRAARGYVEARWLPWRVLSALHGLVEPDRTLAPYDRTMEETKRDPMNHWPWNGQGYLCGLRGRILSTVWQYPHGAGLWPRGTPVVLEVHAGALYVEAVRAALGGAVSFPELTVEAPLEGLQIGERLRWYAERRLARAS